MTPRENLKSLLRRRGYETPPPFFFLCPHLETGSKGGLWCAPTHILEPEVPWENILAYVDACREYKGK